MERYVDLVLEQRDLDLLYEGAEDLAVATVAAGLDRDDFGFVTKSDELRRKRVGLGEREATAPSSEAKFNGPRPPTGDGKRARR